MFTYNKKFSDLEQILFNISTCEQEQRFFNKELSFDEYVAINLKDEDLLTEAHYEIDKQKRATERRQYKMMEAGQKEKLKVELAKFNSEEVATFLKARKSYWETERQIELTTQKDGEAVYELEATKLGMQYATKYCPRNITG